MIPAGRFVIDNAIWDASYRLHTLGDIHWGAYGCHEKGVDRTLKDIENDDLAYWIGMGDYVDMISTKDKRYDPESVAPQHRQGYFKAYGKYMAEYATEKFRPIAHKCLGLLMGNHEWKYGVAFEQRIVQDMAEELKVPFLGYACLRDLVFLSGEKVRRFRIMAHHGAGAGRTTGAKINRLLGLMNNFDADIYLMGHVHECACKPVEIIKANDECTHLEDTKKLGVLTGTFLKGYAENHTGAASYSERAMYSPAALGAARIRIIPEQGTKSLAFERG